MLPGNCVEKLIYVTVVTACPQSLLLEPSPILRVLPPQPIESSCNVFASTCRATTAPLRHPITLPHFESGTLDKTFFLRNNA
jgi:hypothetical protein